jgi:hypothetical protein
MAQDDRDQMPWFVIFPVCDDIRLCLVSEKRLLAANVIGVDS